MAALKAVPPQVPPLVPPQRVAATVVPQRAAVLQKRKHMLELVATTEAAEVAAPAAEAAEAATEATGIGGTRQKTIKKNHNTHGGSLGA